MVCLQHLNRNESPVPAGPLSNRLSRGQTERKTSSCGQKDIPSISDLTLPFCLPVQGCNQSHQKETPNSSLPKQNMSSPQKTVITLARKTPDLSPRSIWLSGKNKTLQRSACEQSSGYTGTWRPMHAEHGESTAVTCSQPQTRKSCLDLLLPERTLRRAVH